MIVFELICAKRHRFEGWFASAGDFDGQKAGGLLACPACGNSSVEKLLTAKIRKQEVEPARERPLPAPSAPAQSRDLNELIDVILLNTEDVGNEFPAEARRIHHKEIPQRNIRGVATREETEELIEEGIAVMPLPVPPHGDWH